MNEEQLEAETARLERIVEKHHRDDGWRHGLVQESRRERIKRLRRWQGVLLRYPDRIPSGHDYFKLVCQREVNGVELMVISRVREVPTWNWDKSELLPYADWDSVTQYNGYCRFRKKPVHERGYAGILNYVPVHGGITYTEHKLGVSTYGFDTAHADDENNPLVRNVEWVEYQCMVMARGIQIAAQFEPDYLRFKGQDCRAVIIDKYHARLKRLISTPFVLTDNFGAMINVLFGKL